MDNNTMNTSAQPQFQSQAQSTASAPVSYNQGGTKKSSSILTIVFLITTLGFAGAFAWAMFRGNGGTSADKAGEKCVVTQEQVDNPEEGTVAEVVADYDADSYVRGLIRTINKKIYDYAYSTTKSYDDGVNYYADEYTSTTSKSYGIRVINSWRDMGRAAGSGPEDFARRAVAEILTNEGFTKDTTVSDSTDESGYYRKDGYMCVFGTNDGYLTVDCASEKWFTDADKALADAVNKAKGYNKDFYIKANRNYVTTTPDGRYERAEISVFPANSHTGGRVDLFYRKVDGGEWTYVTSTQGAPYCKDFEGDAVEAYFGTPCSYEENGEWQIKQLGE